jgi:hypothetical protein
VSSATRVPINLACLVMKQSIEDWVPVPENQGRVEALSSDTKGKERTAEGRETLGASCRRHCPPTELVETKRKMEKQGMRNLVLVPEIKENVFNPDMRKQKDVRRMLPKCPSDSNMGMGAREWR